MAYRVIGNISDEKTLEQLTAEYLEDGTYHICQDGHVKEWGYEHEVI